MVLARSRAELARLLTVEDRDGLSLQGGDGAFVLMHLDISIEIREALDAQKNGLIIVSHRW